MQADTALSGLAPIAARAPDRADVPAALDRVAIALYRPGDEDAILDCIRACFGCEPDLARWRQLYLDNPAGESIIVLARAGRDVVGHLAIIPRRIRVFGRIAIVGHQIDGMTRPAWRKRGVRKTVAEQARRHAVLRGWAATYGVTNEQSTHTTLTHERRRSLGSLPLMIRPLRPIAIAEVLLSRGLGDGAHPDEPDVVDCAAVGLPRDDGRLARAASSVAPAWHAPVFDERHTRLFGSAADMPPIAFVRDAAYLAWRYPDTASSPYLQCDAVVDGEIVATAILRIGAVGAFRVGFLLEWHWRPDAYGEARRLVREAAALARAAGAHGIAALAMPRTAQRRRLQHLGFVPVPGAVLPRTSVVSVRPERRDEEVVPWVHRTNWYLTCGDGFIL